MKIAVALPLVLVALALGGCAQTVTTRLRLPGDHLLVRDQLVIHSSFALPANHRLIEDLVARRLDLKDRLGIPLSDEPIHVYLFAGAEPFEAFMRLYHPKFPPRRAYFLKTDTRLQIYAQWGDRVAEDLRHEITHAYVHAVVPDLPLWLDEGLAEYFEVPRGSGGVNESHLEAILGQRRSGRWQPDLTRLESLDQPFAMTQGDYAEAWAWVHFLLETGLENRVLLREYLLEWRQAGSAEPLSERLRGRIDLPEQAMLAHIEHLGAAAGF